MIKFKEDRHETEFFDLATHNPGLHGVLSCLADFVDIQFGKDVVITCIHRTAEENAALYNRPTPQAPISEHMTWGAADLRSSIYSEAEIRDIVSFLNHFKRDDGRATALFHTIPGNAPHFHVQYFKDIG